MVLVLSEALLSIGIRSVGLGDEGDGSIVLTASSFSFRGCSIQLTGTPLYATIMSSPSSSPVFSIAVRRCTILYFVRLGLISSN